MRVLRTVLAFAFASLAASAADELVPMRDGVRLCTRITLPSGSGPFPAVLIRTPEALDSRWQPFVRAGYAVVEQNVRGRFGSEGKWELFGTGIEDGYDTVEWIAAQPWSNQKVGVLGDGAAGGPGYMALMSGAPHLSAGAVQDGQASPYSAAAFPGGVYQSGLMNRWFPPDSSSPEPVFYPHLQKLDAQLAGREISARAAEVNVPILHFTNWFSPFTQSCIDFYRLAQNRGTGKAAGTQKLVVHSGIPGEIDFDGQALRWFDYWLRDLKTGVRTLPAARYYSLGANRWRSAAGWPPRHTLDPLYLQPGGGLSRSPYRASSSSSSFDYDPGNPLVSPSEQANPALTLRPLDQRPLENRADILRFTTLPLTAPVEIAGPIHAELFVSTTARDTDFFVRLIDIHPDGFEALMVSRPLRLRFREGFDQMLPARRNVVYPIRVGLSSLAMVFPAGHRIRVEVTSSETPAFEPHSNTWKPVKSMDEAIQVTNTVHHSSRYPSRIILPTVEP